MLINDRIEEIIKHYHLNKNSFSIKLGLTNNTTIGQIVAGRRTKPSYDILNKIMENFPEIDSEWLLTGKGNMLKEETDQNDIYDNKGETIRLTNDKEYIKMKEENNHLKELVSMLKKEVEFLRINIDKLVDQLNKS